MPNIERITTILEKLKPLNEEKMFLETRYSINKENKYYTKYNREYKLNKIKDETY